MINAYFACVNANGGVNGHPLKLSVELDQTQPVADRGGRQAAVQTDHVVAIDGVFDLLECTLDASYWKPLGIYEMDAGHRARVLVDAQQRRRQHGPALQLRRRRAVRDQHRHAKKIVFVQSNVPGTGVHRRRVRRRSPRRGARADHRADRERADHGRQLGRAQAGRRRRPQRRGRAELHPARGARSSSRPRRSSASRTGSSRGAARRRATPTSWPRRSGRSGTTSCSSTPRPSTPTITPAPSCSSTGRSSPSTAPASRAASASFSQLGFLLAKFLVQALDTVKGSYTIKSVNTAIEGDQELHVRDALPAVDLRQAVRCTFPTTRTTRSRRRTARWSRCPGLHRHLELGPADRPVP